MQVADLFHLEVLEKDFIKRENKKKFDHYVKIENDIEGLLNYLTAPNIRHKVKYLYKIKKIILILIFYQNQVKHLLFLAFKFSNCFKIYYNKTLLPDETVNFLLK